MKNLITFVVVATFININDAKIDTKYSQDKQNLGRENDEKPLNAGGKFSHYQSLDKSFRTNKLNLLWQKAFKVCLLKKNN